MISFTETYITLTFTKLLIRLFTSKKICILKQKINLFFKKNAICFFSQTSAHFWKAWHEFEVKHGNEDTFREMLRIKRSVQAQYNTQVNIKNY